MAKVTGPVLSLGAQGRLKQKLTYQGRPKGSAVYIGGGPGSRAPFLPSAAQAARRAFFQGLIAQWKLLDSSQKAQWNTNAKQAHYFGTGYNYFLHSGGGGVSGGAYLGLELGGHLLTETGFGILLG